MKRRSFFTLLTGAVSAPFIAPSLCAAVEVQAAPSVAATSEIKRNQMREVIRFFQEEVERVWIERNRAEFDKLASMLPKCDFSRG
jgi:hypothetical protein